ncbi:hypothetical protein [Mesoterricola silvestris]|uniref:Histone-lysine N-methyltransferase, H3 lysine-79 specific n=1 Tax=Mesoterricola silvestris TaxID=2927979 RepID=A0AA48GNK4_9BACT|nr:hypothetical protein [Mesoterricola silvestris]BDU74619.1 hypothetical protein METEAL_37930 [Mesoterricola silvestris]
MLNRSASRLALLLSLAPLACEAPRTLAPAAARPPVLSWRVASAHLEDIFEQIPSSSIEDFRRDTPDAERVRVNASHGEAGVKDDKAHVYGEPAPATTDLMLRRLGAAEDDVLYDLGSGRGYFLMQALLTTPLRRAVGVELASSRVAVALAARKALEERGLLAGRTLDLREQDMAQADYGDATLVYMDSVFYSDELLRTVAQRLSRAKKLRTIVMIMKGLPPNPWFEVEARERWKMSWSPKFGSEVIFYRRTAAPAG